MPGAKASPRKRRTSPRKASCATAEGTRLASRASVGTRRSSTSSPAKPVSGGSPQKAPPPNPTAPAVSPSKKKTDAALLSGFKTRPLTVELDRVPLEDETVDSSSDSDEGEDDGSTATGTTASSNTAASGASSGAARRRRKKGTGFRGKRKKGGVVSASHLFRFVAAIQEEPKPIYCCAFSKYLKGNISYLATVCRSDITIYELTQDEMIAKQVYVAPPVQYGFEGAECIEDFYTCTWLFHPHSSNHYVAAGGYHGVIRLLSISTGQIESYPAHGNAVNELVVHPTDSYLLLSASSDRSLKLWNTRAMILVAVFGGFTGSHSASVLCADFDYFGDYIISSGMDHSVKIWPVAKNPDIVKAIAASHTWTGARLPPVTVVRQEDMAALATANNNSKSDRLAASSGTTWFKPVRVYSPTYSATNVHKNYADCVKFINNHLIISKSCEKKLLLWKAGDYSTPSFTGDDEGHFVVLQDFQLDECTLWFMKFAICPNERFLAIGNDRGAIVLYDLDEVRKMRGDPTKPAPGRKLENPKCVSPVRFTAFSPNGRILVAVCENGTVWRWNFIGDNKEKKAAENCSHPPDK